MNTTNQIHRRRKQMGFTLLEALFAFVVLAGGLLALFRFHATTMESTAEAKIRAEAMALGEQKLEELRSFISAADFDATIVDGAGLGDYAGVDYAAAFTRSWTVAGNNPRELTVTVGWTDRSNSAQNVELSTLVWKTEPEMAGTQFATALASSPPGSGGFGGGGNPVYPNTGEGVGYVDVDPVYDGSDDSDPLTLPGSLYWDVTLSGTIEATDDGLDGADLTGGPDNGTPPCTISGNINTPVPVSVDELGNWLDENGDVVSDPYIYTCQINGIPDGATWDGILSFDPAGNDAVCIPDGGSVVLRLDQNTPFDLQLGTVVLTNNGACNQL